MSKFLSTVVVIAAVLCTTVPAEYIVRKYQPGIALPPPKAGESFNFYIFALQKCDPSSEWTIHGLWPSDSQNSWPSYCSNAPFSQSAIQDLWSDIQTHWPSCTWAHQSETDFLSHEWEKHGTCSNLSEHDYFAEALKIYNGNTWQSQCTSEENECKVQVSKTA